MSDYVTAVEAAKKVRAALRAAFPSAKFSVTSGSNIDVRWSDAGPSLEDVQTALQSAPFVSANDRCSSLGPKADGYYIWLDRYNVAEREAYQRDAERHRQEWREQERRKREAVEQAEKAKRAAMAKVPNDFRPDRAEIDPSLLAAFDQLRQRAEAGVTVGEGDRRPSWAPPLILGDELADACRALGYLAPEDTPIGRLWAEFASPKRSHGYLREHVSAHGLPGLACRGFELFAGGARRPRSEMLFEAQQSKPGDWRFGPDVRFYDYRSPREREWAGLIEEREHILFDLERHPEHLELRTQAEPRLAQIAAVLDQIDREDAVAGEKHRERQRLRQRALELARARILDFVGAPEAQMQLAGRLCGHCCRWLPAADRSGLARARHRA
jgi:hypothetical protein